MQYLYALEDDQRLYQYFSYSEIGKQDKIETNNLDKIA